MTRRKRKGAMVIMIVMITSRANEHSTNEQKRTKYCLCLYSTSHTLGDLFRCYTIVTQKTSGRIFQVSGICAPSHLQLQLRRARTALLPIQSPPPLSISQTGQDIDGNIGIVGSGSCGRLGAVPWLVHVELRRHWRASCGSIHW